MKKFNPSSHHRDRAVQAWLILVGAAMQRQTLTYKGLSLMMYNKRAQGVLDQILGHIAFYCNDNYLPPLTSIVVGQKRGTPGSQIPIDLSEIDAAREKVYEENWYDICPPNAEELHKAFEKNMKKIRKKKK